MNVTGLRFLLAWGDFQEERQRELEIIEMEAICRNAAPTSNGAMPGTFSLA